MTCPFLAEMDTLAAGSVLRSHGPYPYLAINRLYTLILGQPPRLNISPKRNENIQNVSCVVSHSHVSR